MKRVVTAAVLFLAWASPAVGQDTTAARPATQQDEAYKRRREALVKELQNAQKAVAEIRGERIKLQARIENVIAEALRQRANALLLTQEATALRELDSLLTMSQDNLLAQRDRFVAVGDAVRRRTGAVMIVLLRADSTQGQLLNTAKLTINGTPAETHTYSVAANNALAMGAVDQLYRANVLPTPHAVTLDVIVNNQTVTQTVNVTAGTDAVTYIQFVVRNGQVTSSTWTSRGTTPF